MPYGSWIGRGWRMNDGRRLMPFVTTFDGGESVHWFDDFDVLRVVSVKRSDGTTVEFPGSPSLAGCLAQGMPAELTQGVVSHWASLREVRRGPWIFASQATVLTYDRSDGTLLSARCPGATCTATSRITEGCLEVHDNPVTFAECGWGGVRIVNDLALRVEGVERDGSGGRTA